MGCPTSPITVPSIVLVSAGLSCDVDAWTICTRETSIGGCTLVVSSSKNLRLRLTSRLLLKGPRTIASDDSGSARCGRVGGCRSCFVVRDAPGRDNFDVSSAVISGEYTGGREDSRGGMIGGGSGADGSLRRGWRRLDSRAGYKRGMKTYSLPLILAVTFLFYHRQGTGYVGTLYCFHYSPLRVSSTPMGSFQL